MRHPFEDNICDFYELLLLGPLAVIYNGRKETELKGFLNYSNLIIDKFAIHSLSFFHLSKGIVEVKKSNETVQMSAYDLFSVNTIFRTMMENYATFNHLFVEPKSIDEQEFRFLLWKIDGLFDKQRFDIKETDFNEAKSIMENDKKVLTETINEFENCKFYSQFEKSQLEKIYKPDKKKFSWRFLLDNEIIMPLTITELIKHTCKSRGFINQYRYTSIHTHTNYLSIEHFEQTKGKRISKEYTDPIIKLAVYLTSMMISDIKNIDVNAEKAFRQLPEEIKDYIDGISKAIKSEK